MPVCEGEDQHDPKSESSKSESGSNCDSKEIDLVTPKPCSLELGRFPFPLEIMDYLIRGIGTLRDISACYAALPVHDPAKSLVRDYHTGRCLVDIIPLNCMDIDTILICRQVCRDWKKLVDGKLEKRMMKKVTKERSNREWTAGVNIGDVRIKRHLFVTPLFLKHEARRGVPGLDVKLTPMMTRWIGVHVNFLEGMDEWLSLVEGCGRSIWCFELTATIRFVWELEEFVNRLLVYICYLPNLRSLSVNLEGEPFFITSHNEHEFADLPDVTDLPSLPHLEDLRMCSIIDPYLTIQFLRKYGPQLKNLAFANDFNHMRIAMNSQANVKPWPIKRLDLSRVMIELPERFQNSQGFTSRLPMFLEFLENFKDTLTDLEICLGGFFHFPETPNVTSTLLGWDKSRLPRLESLTVYNCEVKDIDFIMAWSESLKFFELKMSLAGKRGKININRRRRGVYKSNLWNLMPALQTYTETELTNNRSVKSVIYRRSIYEAKMLEKKKRKENSPGVKLKNYIRDKCNSLVSGLRFWRK